MPNRALATRVCLVTGASRGVGKGVALGLGEAGAIVYITGRTIEEGKADVRLGGTIQQTAEEVTKLGGHGIAIRCDHRDDAQVRDVFERIRLEHRHLDLLVNNAWGGYRHFYDGTEFWKEKGFWDKPLERWDSMFDAGVRAHYVASVLAAPMMIAAGRGLIVNISSTAANDEKTGAAYSAAKAAEDQMVRCMAHELRSHNVAVVGVHPGLVRTEGVMTHEKFFAEQLKTNSESPQFVGRGVAALAADDANIMTRSGQIVTAAQLGRDYDFTDLDGRQPM